MKKIQFGKKLEPFSERVRAVVRKIPKGEVRTYAEVAQLAGSPNAYRAVANTMAKNFDTTVPCHRVVGKNGKLCGYNRGGIEVKRKLLLSEGVTLK